MCPFKRLFHPPENHHFLHRLPQGASRRCSRRRSCPIGQFCQLRLREVGATRRTAQANWPLLGGWGSCGRVRTTSGAPRAGGGISCVWLQERWTPGQDRTTPPSTCANKTNVTSDALSNMTIASILKAILPKYVQYYCKAAAFICYYYWVGATHWHTLVGLQVNFPLSLLKCFTGQWIGKIGLTGKLDLFFWK